MFLPWCSYQATALQWSAVMFFLLLWTSCLLSSQGCLVFFLMLRIVLTSMGFNVPGTWMWIQNRKFHYNPSSSWGTSVWGSTQVRKNGKRPGHATKNVKKKVKLLITGHKAKGIFLKNVKWIFFKESTRATNFSKVVKSLKQLSQLSNCH